MPRLGSELGPVAMFCYFLSSEFESHQCSVKMENLTSRKKLWLSIREHFPKLTIKRGKDLEDAVRTRLLVLLALPQPLTQEQDNFVSNEVYNFTQHIPDFWHKCSRKVNHLFANHSDFFDKVYPFNDFGNPKPAVEVEQSKQALKRSLDFSSKSRSQQWRDKAKLAKEDQKVVLGAAALSFHKSGDKDAAHIIKRLQYDPSIANELRKMLNALDAAKNEERLLYFCH